MVHAHRHHDHKARLEQRDPEPAGVTVYVTAEPTFTGEVGGYSTAGQDDDEPAATNTNVGVGAPVRPTRSRTQEEEQPTATQTTEETRPETTTADEPTQTTTQPPEPIETTTTRSTTSTTTDVDVDTKSTTQTTLSTITSSATETDNNAASTLGSIADQSTPTGSNAAVHSESTGLTSGAKAGVAIGVVLAVGLIAGLIFFFVWKKKKQQQQGEGLEEIDASNEKYYNPSQSPGPPPSTQPMTQSIPPQLNVRPVTQFAPDLTPIQSGFTPASSVGGAAALGPAAAVSRNLTGNSPPQTPQNHTPQSSVSGRDPFGDPVNPFGSQAEVPSPVSAVTRPSTSGNQAEGPPTAITTSAPSKLPGALTITNPSEPEDSGSNTATAAVAGAALGGSAAAAAAAAAAQGAEKKTPNRPGSSESTGSKGSSILASTAPDSNVVDPTPAPMGAASPTGPGPAPMPTNVHRVQMEFVPSMEDELELHGGQLVRLLHEYDDGWALCVKMDRSQQGVVPRSCLSARPVKPRARPPPGAGPGPGPRPGPRGPPGAPGSPMMGPPGRASQSPRFYPADGDRPASPSSRPMSPARGGHGPPPPRAQPPRSMSPASFPAVPRSHSPAGPRQTPPRSMSPGPYGPPGLQRPDMPAAAQRQRSNSTGATPMQNPRATPGRGPSPLAGVAAPASPPPAVALPAIPTSPAPAPSNDA